MSGARDRRIGVILERHHPASTYGDEAAICTYCEQHWPCEVATVAAFYAAARALLDAARAYNAADAAQRDDGTGWYEAEQAMRALWATVRALGAVEA